jgi:hypothetical protein
LVWLLGVALLSGGCSRPGEPPRRYFGLAFGDAPGAQLTRQAVPLPQALADFLAFYAAPGARDVPFGAALSDPVLAFWQGRFFSMEAALAVPAEAEALSRRLGRDLGPPHCRGGATGRTCLWQSGEIEAVLDESGSAPRLMVRHAPTAAAVAAALPQAFPETQKGEQ